MVKRELLKKAIKEEKCVLLAQELVNLTSTKGRHKVIFGSHAHNLEGKIKSALSDFRTALQKIGIYAERKDEVMALARAISQESLRGM